MRTFTVLATLATFAVSACSSSNAGFPSCYGDANGCSVTGEGANIFYQSRQQHFGTASSHNPMCGQQGPYVQNLRYGASRYGHNNFSQNSFGQNQCEAQAVQWVAVPTYHHVFVENLRPAPTTTPDIVTPAPTSIVEPYVPPTPFIEAEPYVAPTHYPSIEYKPEVYLPVRK